MSQLGSSGQSNEKNSALQSLYAGHSANMPWRELWSLRERWLARLDPSDVSYAAVSSPFLTAATAEHLEADVRVMIVGRESQGWGDDNAKLPYSTIDASMAAAHDFIYKQNHGPFWQAARRLSHELNTGPKTSKASLAWSNVFRLDQNGAMPEHGLAKALVGTEVLRGLLAAEIGILTPHVLWLACGPDGDTALQQQLERLPERRPDPFYAVSAPEYAPVVIRGYHPNGLRHRGQFDGALKFIVETARGILLA